MALGQTWQRADDGWGQGPGSGAPASPEGRFPVCIAWAFLPETEVLVDPGIHSPAGSIASLRGSSLPTRRVHHVSAGSSGLCLDGGQDAGQRGPAKCPVPSHSPIFIRHSHACARVCVGACAGIKCLGVGSRWKVCCCSVGPLQLPCRAQSNSRAQVTPQWEPRLQDHCTHTHTSIHIPTYTHIYIHADTYRHMCIHVHTYTDTCTHTHIRKHQVKFEFQINK